MSRFLRLVAAPVFLTFALPTLAYSQENECNYDCCYCDLVVGKCKNITGFPGGGGTGYTNCAVQGMDCHYWGDMCNETFALNHVGPDGVMRR